MRSVVGVLGLALWAAAPALANELVGHGGAVRALAASSDGNLLLSGSFDTSLILWRPGRDAPLARLLGHEAAINAVALAPDGNLALSGGDDGLLFAWRLPAGTERWRLAFDSKVLAVALAPAGDRAAVGTADGLVRLVTVEDGTVVATARLERARPTALLFTEDVGLVLVGTHEGGLWTVEAASGEAQERIPGTGFAVTDLVRIGADRLASASIDGNVRIRRLPDLAVESELAGHEAPLSALAVQPGGGRLATGDIKGRIVLWSLPEGRAERVLEPHRGPVWDLAFSDAPPSLWSAGNDSIVRRWSEGDPPPAPIDTARDASNGAAAAAAGREDERGAKLFRACIACHTVAPDGGNRAGPTLFRLFGRPAGSVPGYLYSEALAKSGIVWSEETVDRLFALGPETFTPGSKMPLQRMPDAGDRAALIAYLKRITTPPEPTAEKGG
ncbi:MAG: c-type cytochrome [Geminicoccaceae bacterium]|nr:c-type cytochrome [Geminicoccaceae bacterium]